MVNECKPRCSPLLVLLLLALSLLALTLPQESEAAGHICAIDEIGALSNAETTQLKVIADAHDVQEREKSFGAGTRTATDKEAEGIGDARVIDEADLLTDAEEQALDAKLAAYEAAHGIRILVGTVKNTHNQVLGKVANAVVDRIVDGGANGTIVLLLAPKERDFYISTDNKMRTRITDDGGIEHLAGQFVPSLKENKYAEGFTAFAAAVDEMVAYYEKEGKPFNPDAFLFTIVTLVGALIPALIVYWFILAHLSDSMLSVRSAHEADDYVERGSFRLTHRADVFLRTTESRETKHKEPSSSSSGSYISTSSRDESHGGGGGKY